MLVCLIIAVITLLYIAFLLYQIKEQLGIKERKSISVHSPFPVASRDGLSEVLAFVDGDWVHHDWVRDKSRRWQHYYDTPGYALRKGAELDEGVQ